MLAFFVRPLVLSSQRSAFIDKLALFVVARTWFTEFLAPCAARYSFVALHSPFPTPIAGPFRSALLGHHEMKSRRSDEMDGLRLADRHTSLPRCQKRDPARVGQ